MGVDLDFLAGTGLDTQTGISYTGSKEKYISAVQRYFKNYEKNRDRITEFYSAGDMDNYMITVHALKSNSKMIGATELSEDFEALEIAAGAGDVATVKEKNDPTLQKYAQLIEKLKPVGQMGDVRAADEITGEVAKQTVESLLEALDDFDDDLSAKLIKKLSGYPFRMTQAAKLKEAAGFVEDFMYDEAADIIREISKTIE